MIGRRQTDTGFLNSNASLAPTCGPGNLLTLKEGSLAIGNDFFTASANEDSKDFKAGVSDPGSTFTFFQVIDSVLSWSNPLFDAGMARFCLRRDQNNIQNVVAVFRGPYPNGCRSIRLVLVACKSSLSVHSIS